ncbi:hypothetical protein BJ912DRAFT_956336 [Pholiota molesta]|nr:hypothetical protein BJ912DRAFT_956336 [Pholiota molesta]
MKLFSTILSVSMLLIVKAGGDALGNRAALTCADPTTAVTAVQSYSPGWKAHLWDPLLEDIIGAISTGSDFQLQGPWRACSQVPPTSPSRYTACSVARCWTGCSLRRPMARFRARQAIPWTALSLRVPHADLREHPAVFGVQRVAWRSLVHYQYQWPESYDTAWYVDSGIQGFVLPLDCSCT